jgi:hypothetical protein
MEPWILNTLGVVSLVLWGAALFAARYRPERFTRPLRWCVIASPVAWICYAVWEIIMQALFPQGRMGFDLLVWFPLLAGLSLCQFVAFFVTIDRVLRHGHARHKPGHNQNEFAGSH